ncbi:hypothetical protein [Proteiniborus sp. MB09-C3]|uniref:hypothetical protein n=1 Tax=Proteiniborus sp. MB09-C3 TaxID=3050072 RepID=UPI00255289F2|nr:hypothetical protein [Proteiniborus sp. MB09-C3]WIV13650.1 hypothetical protein QO263_08085 [Proteiniborus sp. MB09-C3]
MKSNRLIEPKGIKLQLSQFAEYIDPSTLDLVTVKGKKYRVYVYEGPVTRLENALVVISYEVDGDGFKKPIYLVSTEKELLLYIYKAAKKNKPIQDIYSYLKIA